MRTESYETVSTIQACKKCLEYSEEPEKLTELLEKIDVKIKFTGIKKHFPTDKEERLTGVFKIAKGYQTKENAFIRGQEIEFNFGFSIADTEIFIKNQSGWYRGKYYDGVMGSDLQKNRDKKEFMGGLLYTCLACCSSDYYVPIDFDEFCGEFGYDNDSIAAKDTWERCLKQSSKLQRIFKEEEIQCLPS